MLSRPVDGNDIEESFVQLGTILNRVRRLNIDLESSVSNDYLDSLFNALSQHVTGCHIIGAGSGKCLFANNNTNESCEGGFILGWLKQGATKEMVARHLSTSHPNAEISDVTLWMG